MSTQAMIPEEHNKGFAHLTWKPRGCHRSIDQDNATGIAVIAPDPSDQIYGMAPGVTTNGKIGNLQGGSDEE
jgi:hypothetical protein